jgi:hypothetical protein
MPLLIIDDFGLKPLLPAQEEDFHDRVAAGAAKRASVNNARDKVQAQ